MKKSELINQIVLTALALIIGIVVVHFLKKDELKRNSLPTKYTYGVVTKVVSPAKGERLIHFYYTVDGVNYKVVDNLSSRVSGELVGNMFLVSFPTFYPDRGHILLDCRIFETGNFPSDGLNSNPCE